MFKAELIIVGGGLAGLMAAVRGVEKGLAVAVFAMGPAKRSHSACAQGGINAAIDTMGEKDTPGKHFDDTIYGGDFLANQTPVKGMCEAAPELIYMFDRLGTPFNRTGEGLIQMRRLGGTLYHRTVFSGATTGQQLLYSLDEQARRWEVAGKLKRYEGWEFLGAVLDSGGQCCGIVAQEMSRMEIMAFSAGAVIIATGGPGMIFGRTTNSIINTGFAAGALYRQGVSYANGEFVQIHPTAIPGSDKNRLISESTRGEGGRIWTYKNGKKWFFLEEWYPPYGNLVPRDIATRAVFKVCVDMGLGIEGKNMVYLDLSHKDPQELEVKLGGILDIYEKFVGDDPKKVPMKIFPSYHYSMGGLWVDFKQMTNIPGLFAAGECEYQYHGANRLGGNGMLSAIYGGRVAGDQAADFVRSLAKEIPLGNSKLFINEAQKHRTEMAQILKMDGGENPYQLHQELGDWMTENCTVIRYNHHLEKTDLKIQELMERYQNIGINNSSRWANQQLFFIRQLWAMLQLARVITLGALRRDESRGAHYKPDFPMRDDENWLKTTIAEFTTAGPRFSYEKADLQFIKPRQRNYDVTGEDAANG